MFHSRLPLQAAACPKPPPRESPRRSLKASFGGGCRLSKTTRCMPMNSAASKSLLHQTARVLLVWCTSRISVNTIPRWKIASDVARHRRESPERSRTATARDRDLISRELWVVVRGDSASLHGDHVGVDAALQIPLDSFHQDALVSPSLDACLLTVAWFVWEGGGESETRQFPSLRASGLAKSHVQRPRKPLPIQKSRSLFLCRCLVHYGLAIHGLCRMPRRDILSGSWGGFTKRHPRRVCGD